MVLTMFFSFSEFTQPNMLTLLICFKDDEKNAFSREKGQLHHCAPRFMVLQSFCQLTLAKIRAKERGFGIRWLFGWKNLFIFQRIFFFVKMLKVLL